MSVISSPAAAAVDSLRARLRGSVLQPGDPHLARAVAGFNAAVEHRPAVVVLAADADDVARTVRWAAAAGLPVHVKATGHGLRAGVEGGVLICTDALQDCTVDPVRAVARVGAGVRWAAVIEAAAAHGLAPLAGSSPTVGVVGYCLGGGYGPLGRTYGFGADQVRSLEVVTAAGELVDVDAASDPDLFWALRGGGGSHAVVTEIEIGLVPLRRFFGGALFFDGDSAADVLAAYGPWAQALPEEATTSVAVLRLPPVPQVPEPLRGCTVVHVRYAHVGADADGAAALAPLRTAGRIVVDGIGPMPVTALPAIHQDPVDPMPSLTVGAGLVSVVPELFAALLDVAGPQLDVPLVLAEVRMLGGAAARHPAVDSAVGGRDVAGVLHVVAPVPPPLVVPATAAANAVLGAAGPWTWDTCPSTFAPRTPEVTWDAAQLARLRRIKAERDPQRMLHCGVDLAG